MKYRYILSAIVTACAAPTLANAQIVQGAGYPGEPANAVPVYTDLGRSYDTFPRANALTREEAGRAAMARLNAFCSSSDAGHQRICDRSWSTINRIYARRQIQAAAVPAGTR